VKKINTGQGKERIQYEKEEGNDETMEEKEGAITGKKLRNRQKVRSKLNRIKEIKYRRNKETAEINYTRKKGEIYK
jgi:hypothetical protein